MRTQGALGAGLVLLAVARSAAAQTSAAQTSAEAERAQLISQALRASDNGDHPHALDLAARAGRIRMTTHLRMLLAQEHNALGHLLDALDFATRCRHEADADADLPERARVLEGCRAVVNAVRARVGQVTVRAPVPAPQELHVRIQGNELARAQWGVPYAVLPGTVVVEAVAAGGSTFHSEVVVAVGETREVVLTIAPGTAVVRNDDGAAPAADRRGSRGPGAGPWVVAGAGVAVLGAAAVFYALRGAAVSDRNAACDAAYCDPPAADAQDRARTWTTLTDVALVGGGALVACGALWFVLAWPRAEAPARAAWNWQVAPAPHGVTLGLGGSF